MGRRLPPADFFLPGWLKSARGRRALLSAARQAPRILHLTHGQCLDGIGCDVVHRMRWGDDVRTHFIHPAHVPDALQAIQDVPGEDRTLSISDLSWSVHRQADILDALRTLRGGGWRVEWRDHHHKQWEGVDDRTLGRHLDVVEVDRELSECGATLVQKALLPKDPFAKQLAAVVRDRDLWLNQDPLSEKLEFVASKLGSEETVRRLSEERDLDAPWIDETYGEVLAENGRLTRRAVREARVERRRGWTVGLIYGQIPKNVTLHALREERGTDMEVNLKPDGEMSVRSRRGADVAHLVGQAFAGGGHPNAAGGRLELSPAALVSLWARGARDRTADRILGECFRQLEAVAPSDRKKGKATRSGAKDRGGGRRSNKATKAPVGRGGPKPGPTAEGGPKGSKPRAPARAGSKGSKAGKRRQATTRQTAPATRPASKRASTRRKRGPRRGAR